MPEKALSLGNQNVIIMKKIILIFAIVSSALFSNAQAKKEQESKSKIEGLSEKSGTLLKKEFIDIGKFNSVQIQVLKITDVSTGAVLAGLRLEKEKKGDDAGSFVVFLDSDEIDGLLKSINYINENVLSKPLPDDYIEYNFQSRSGFRAGVYKASSAKWSAFVQLDKYYDDSQLFLGSDELIQFRDLIIQAKAKL